MAVEPPTLMNNMISKLEFPAVGVAPGTGSRQYSMHWSASLAPASNMALNVHPDVTVVNYFAEPLHKQQGRSVLALHFVPEGGTQPTIGTANLYHDGTSSAKSLHNVKEACVQIYKAFVVSKRQIETQCNLSLSAYIQAALSSDAPLHAIMYALTSGETSTPSMATVIACTRDEDNEVLVEVLQLVMVILAGDVVFKALHAQTGTNLQAFLT
eukprot:1387075-Rhodomonas_salina.1